MMAETAVERSVCKGCGAEVRDESLFCYNCGESVGEPAESLPMVVEKDRHALAPADTRPPLTSAASLRKERRAFSRKPVEISWEPREGSSVIFVIVTVMLTAAALILLVLALYLR